MFLFCQQDLNTLRQGIMTELLAEKFFEDEGKNCNGFPDR
jgi:hypothetical protein